MPPTPGNPGKIGNAGEYWKGLLGKIDTLADADTGTRLDLRLMATTDLHMQILPPVRGDGQAAPGQGFVRTASLIRRARREARNVLLLDNGDFLCSNGREALARGRWRRSHPMIRVMNHLGYDAATPGNHDFDHGLDYLAEVAGQAHFPFVSANVLRRGASTNGSEAVFPPYILLERSFHDRLGLPHFLRIGIVGFLPPNSVTGAAELITRDIVATARKLVPRLQEEGADLIVALAHSGLDRARYRPGMENAAVPLAALPGIDAVICGHNHRIFPGPDWPRDPAIDPKQGRVHGKPVVSAGFRGSHLGLIDMELEKTARGWRVANAEVQLRSVLQVQPGDAPGTARPVRADGAVRRIVAPALDLLDGRSARRVSRTVRPIHSFFALAGPSPAVQLVQAAQSAHLRRLIADGLAPDLPLLSSAGAFRAGGFDGPGNFTAIAPGPLTLSDLADLYPFPNRLAVLELDGHDLRLWLERAASIFNRADPAAPAPVALKPRQVPGYMFETVLGVEYEIDLSAPALFDPKGRIKGQAKDQARGQTGGRIARLRWQGRPVSDRDRFLLITNTYRTGGGGNYPRPPNSPPLDIPQADMQQVLCDFAAARDRLDLPLVPHWRLAPLGGARMRFRTAPGALGAHADFPGGEIEPAGRDGEGYQLFDLLL